MKTQGMIFVRLALGLLLISPTIANAQLKTRTPPSETETAILQALRSNPETGPYSFQTSKKDGNIVLSGRVGTKQIHDLAVRIAIDITPSLNDSLVIDTSEAHRVAEVSAAAQSSPNNARSNAMANAGVTILPGMAGAPLVYPPPLFGRYDDPFWGFEPPLISYPPWWSGVVARQGDPYGAPVLDPDSPIGADPGPGSSTSTGSNIPAGSVEMTLDPRGVALLRGNVPTDADRVAIGQKVARMEGVTDVINRLQVQAGSGPAIPAARARDVPPPPPMPDPDGKLVPKPPVPDAPVVNSDPLAKRIQTALSRRPALAGIAVDVKVNDGVATLSGEVPSALEAMIAFRAAQQTLGVRVVEDRLKFVVPNASKPNPLVTQGRPEDVEPYLLAQIGRQVGDQAHIDRVQVVGDRLEIMATIASADDRARIEAILRSMPLLRGFDLNAKLTPE